MSACLLGHAVRFDGGHKRSAFATDALSEHVDWVLVCPEVEMGLPVPRESMRLVGGPDHPRLLGHRSGRDFSDEMRDWAAGRVEQLAGLDLDGYILKKDSPSCGLTRVRLYPSNEGDGAAPSRDGVGLFAAALRARMPDLPVTEEGRLNDAGLRESFLAQVFTHARLRPALAGAPARELIAQHAAHKLLFMAHSPDGQRRLGRIVAVAGRDAGGVAAGRRYVAAAMQVLGVVATRGRHANVLQHALGYLKTQLTPADKEELLVVIDRFRRGVHELAVPLTLLAHHVRRLAGVPPREIDSPAGATAGGRADPVSAGLGWLREQIYFAPFPRELHA